tara:strand:- start:2638 stop:3648 length:1011 start_codon:yes stop_codon:yes gene_type:complete
MSRNPKNPKNPEILTKKYICEKCDYSTDSKKDFNKHLGTAKHKKMMDAIDSGDISNHSIPKNPENKIFTCVNCERKFKSNSGLWRHKKSCINEDESEEKCEEIVEKPTNKDKELELKDMFLTVVNENKELRSMMVEQQKSMVEQQKTIMAQSKQMTEIIPKLGNSTTNNNTINNNQRFSINVFLNEKCKDAINMSDFIKSIQVSLEQLDFTKTQGLEKGISNVIMENMNKLSVYERPMHCTDTKRETIYIKDNNTWEKDKSKEKIKNAIRKTSNKNYTALTNWTRENPDFMEDDEKQMFYARAMSTLGKPMDGLDDKIVKKICSNTYLKESLDNED